MNVFWISIAVSLTLLAAFLPDDAAIALDLVDLWIRTAWVWIQGQRLKASLWIRLKWDGSWISWRLWVIRQRSKHNRNNNTEGNE